MAIKKILITGGSGFIGRHLTGLLTASGYEVAWLGRSVRKWVRTFEWNYQTQTIDPDAIQFADCIINLAGAGIANHRWTNTYKKEIYDSRIMGTKLLISALSKHTHQVKKFIQISATGIYAENQQDKLNEDAPSGTSFLAEVCKDWEAEADKVKSLRIDLTIIRTGIVLAPDGGFIAKMKTPITCFVGASPGNGKQLLSWIHIHDLCRLFRHVIERPQMPGICNAIADGPITSNEMTHLMAEKMHRKIILPPIPEFVLHLIFGEISEELVASHSLSNQRIKDSGFQFLYPTASAALDNVLKNTKN